ncbi:MAG: hypothetical protein M3220_10295 [Chloroflexota bacterium]|nr:hypothetical protein [Chloroflexota bacterium]
MSERPQAATPTVGSLLPSQSGAQVDPQFAAETSRDTLDWLIQGFIGAILLGVIVLVAFAGWTLVRR